MTIHIGSDYDRLSLSLVNTPMCIMATFNTTKTVFTTSHTTTPYSPLSHTTNTTIMYHIHHYVPHSPCHVACHAAGCFKTTICCPRCVTPWGTPLDGLPDFTYNFMMQGLRGYSCSTCLLNFGCVSAIHKCPHCKADYDFDSNGWYLISSIFIRT